MPTLSMLDTMCWSGNHDRCTGNGFACLMLQRWIQDKSFDVHFALDFVITTDAKAFGLGACKIPAFPDSVLLHPKLVSQPYLGA